MKPELEAMVEDALDVSVREFTWRCFFRLFAWENSLPISLMNKVTAGPSVSFWPRTIVACRLPHPALPQPIAASGIMSDRSRGQPSKSGMSHREYLRHIITQRMNLNHCFEGRSLFMSVQDRSSQSPLHIKADRRKYTERYDPASRSLLSISKPLSAVIG
ncbi:hypothetical protein CN234_35155 [Sinorhizobium meliloti]|nr:hypothetical protein CN234_35155 [Sinorhizobium meliloti]RVG42044.1 hypothetical protein CN226_35085 [Sinorhizobium meliloti]